jgi:phosphate transport system permease protein
MTVRKRTQNALYYGVVVLFAFLTISCLVVILVYIMGKGLPHLSWEFLTGKPRVMGKEGGIFPVIAATVYVTGVAVLLAGPIGVGAAVFFTEYAKEGRWLAVIRALTEVLAGIPSILFGLFGFSFFVVFLGFGWSVLSGGLTLSLMILPTVVRATEESLKTVPVSYREGSLSLGATRWTTTAKVILPCCSKGILTGLILGVGRAVGETAAVYLTLGGALKLPLSPFDSGRTMSMHMYILTAEGISPEKAYATAALLVFLILIINALAKGIGRKVSCV